MDHATLARTTSHTASPKTTLPTALLEHSGKQVFVLLFHIVKIIIFTYKFFPLEKESRSRLFQ